MTKNKNKFPKLISENDLRKRWKERDWEIDDFILFDLIDNFDLAAYDSNSGEQIVIDNKKDAPDHIVDMDSYSFDLEVIENLEKGDPELIEESILKQKIKQGEIEAAIIPEKPDSNKLINRWERRLINIKNSSAGRDLGACKKGYFDRKKREANQEIKDLSTVPHLTVGDYENFIRSLVVHFENDNEVGIREPGKEAQAYTCQTLGFRNNQTKEWKTFLDILRDPPHTYDIGSPYFGDDSKRKRNPDYDAKLKLVGNISNKLIRFFNKRFNVNIPQNYKLYERCKSEKKGTYKFKFQVVYDDIIKSGFETKYEKLSKDRLIKLLLDIRNESIRAPNGINQVKIKTISNILRQKHRCSDSDIIDIIKPDEEDIRFDPHENIEDKEQDY
jgi:hypothetical protein